MRLGFAYFFVYVLPLMLMPLIFFVVWSLSQ
jgi:hypothetical protein